MVVWIGINRARDWFESKEQYEQVLRIIEMFNAQSVEGIKNAASTRLSEADRKHLKG